MGLKLNGRHPFQEAARNLFFIIPEITIPYLILSWNPS